MWVNHFWKIYDGRERGGFFSPLFFLSAYFYREFGSNISDNGGDFKWIRNGNQKENGVEIFVVR